MEFDPWTQSLVNAMSTMWGSVAAFIPRLFGALVVLLLGFVVAKLLDTLLSKLLAKLGLDRLMAGTGLTKMMARIGIQVPVSTLIGKIVYWFVLLVFLVSAADSLGLQRVSATLDVFALYLPKVFGAAWYCWPVCCWRNWSTAWCAEPRKAWAWITLPVSVVSPRPWSSSSVSRWPSASWR